MIAITSLGGKQNVIARNISDVTILNVVLVQSTAPHMHVQNNMFFSYMSDLLII